MWKPLGLVPKVLVHISRFHCNLDLISFMIIILLSIFYGENGVHSNIFFIKSPKIMLDCDY